MSISSWNGTWPLNIPLDATVRNLKERIGIHENVPGFNRSLTLDKSCGERVDDLEDHLTLEHYEIQNGSTIIVDENIKLHINTSRVRAHALNMFLHTTVWNLKCLISNALGLPVETQTLTCGGEVLQDDRKLGSYALLYRSPSCTIQATCMYSHLRFSFGNAHQAAAQQHQLAGLDHPEIVGLSEFT